MEGVKTKILGGAIDTQHYAKQSKDPVPKHPLFILVSFGNHCKRYVWKRVGGGSLFVHMKKPAKLFSVLENSVIIYYVFIKQYRYNLNQGNWNKLRVTVQELTSNYFTEVCLRKKLQVEIYQAWKFTLFLF